MPVTDVALTADTQIQALTAEVSNLQTQASTLEVIDAHTAVTATNLLGFVARVKKNLEERRKFFVQPLNDQVKRVNDFFKQQAAPLEQADQTLRSKALSYQQAEAQRRREEEAKLRALAEQERQRLQALADKKHAKQVAWAEKKGVEPPAPPPEMTAPQVYVPQAATTVKAALGTSSVAKVWDFEIVDVEQIPRAFLVVNEQMIRAAVRGGTRQIPGVRIFERDQLRVGTR